MILTHTFARLLPLTIHQTAHQSQPCALAADRDVDHAPTGSSTPFAGTCEGYSFPSVVCVARYGSVLHGAFKRPIRNQLANADTYPETFAPSDPTFANLGNASFVMFDSERALELLGQHPSIEYMFELEHKAHEGLVYSPETDELLFSEVKPGQLSQFYVNLAVEPPILSQRMADPPLWAMTGTRYRKGLVYGVTLSGSDDVNGQVARPSVVALNVTSGRSQVLLNNYFGYYFNSLDDLDIDSEGRIWFSDNDYGRPAGINDQPPHLNTAVYRFNPSTGEVVIVEDTLSEPNGVQFSVDGTKLFLTDTGAGVASIDPTVSSVPDLHYNETGKRTVYAYDVISGRHLLNKRPIHLAMDYVPDGIKVSREGYILTASGYGITVLTEDGDLLMRIQTNYTVVTLAWAGKDSEQLWAVGAGGATRIRLGLKGPLPVTS